MFGADKLNDINARVEKLTKNKDAVLIDVRTPEENREGRIPDSINIPLDDLQKVTTEISDKSTPLYVYCRSGARSGQAVDILKQMGYTNSVNIGGIIDYNGKKETD